MEIRQEEAFWDTIKALDELDILKHVMVIGSWAEYLFPPLFNTDFIPNIINILADYACEIERNGYKIVVPEPSVYVIQKILTNPDRVPTTKKQKDIMAVEELLIHIKQSKYHLNKLKEINNNLTKKQLAIVKKVTEDNFIDLFN